MTRLRTHSWLRSAATVALLAAPALALAAPDLGAAQKQPLNWHAIGMFFVFVLMTLGITYWAAGRSKSASDFYTAGGGITGKQNGLAIAGDFMSAATLLGLTAMIYGDGVDGYIYMVAFFVGWPIILFLMAERLRNLGKFTFADITAYRLSQGPVRTMAAISSLTVVCFYLVAQMVGAGQLIKLLFGLDYNVALVVVGVLMMVYVIFGGMVATTWVQIIKACMLLAGGTAIMLLAFAQFGFSLDTLLTKAMEVHRLGTNMLSPGKLLADPVTALSMGLGLMFVVHGLLVALAGINPLRFFRKVWPVLTFAFTSRSSAASIPLSIEAQTRRLGIPQSIAGFAASFGATIGQNGCAGLYPAMLAVMVAPTVGINPLDPLWIATLVAIVTLSSAGVAGVGGGATFAALIVLPAMGLPVSLVALLISVEPLIDMGRTALNVNGSMTAGAITSQIMGQTDKALLDADEHAELAQA